MCLGPPASAVTWQKTTDLQTNFYLPRDFLRYSFIYVGPDNKPGIRISLESRSLLGPLGCRTGIVTFVVLWRPPCSPMS
jgi:hypothetical protein